MKSAWKRPAHCPREIRSKWPGISYPGKGYCQARRRGHSRSFAYGKHGGVIAAHKAATEWMDAAIPPVPPVRVSVSKATPETTGNGVNYHACVRSDGRTDYSWQVYFRAPNGQKRKRTFYIGSSNTWTKARERAAWKAARDFRLAYEQWRLRGGVHPIDTKDHYWSAAEH